MWALLAVPAGLAGWILVSRYLYNCWRPYLEPVNCTTSRSCRDDGHRLRCYRKYDDIDYKGKAAALALLVGLLWPLVWIPLVVVAKPKLRPAETAAKVKRLEAEKAAMIRQLEAENEKLRLEQETT